MMITDTRDVNIMQSYDIIVVGGGVAGISAAVSASREGAKVLLIEKGINLGGLATTGLISWYEPLCNGKGKQLIFGIAEELITLSCKYSFDNLSKKWGGTEGCRPTSERYATYFSPTVFSLALDEYVLDNKVEILFDTMATTPVMDGEKALGVICETFQGRCFYEAKIIIDATGDASVMHRAGVPTVIGENYMVYVSHIFDKQSADKYSKDGDTASFRRWKFQGGNCLGEGHPESAGKIQCTDNRVITDFITRGKKMLLDYLKQKDRQSYDVMSIPYMPQLRTIRRIVGDVDFNGNENEHFEDSIGVCADFRYTHGKEFEISYRSLINSKYPNLIAAGRIISAPQGDGWEISRVIPVCALTGEAAGKAAAYCIKNGLNVTEGRKCFIK